MSQQKSLRQQWTDYGSRPPIARWTSRGSLILGVGIGGGLHQTHNEGRLSDG